MSSLMIPRGKTYTFKMTVLERDSFLPKNLDTMDAGTSTFELVNLATLAKIPGSSVIARLADEKLNPGDPDTYANGRLSVTIPSTITAVLEYERGAKVDDYYSKPTYQGVINLKFADPSDEITAIVPTITVVHTGA